MIEQANAWINRIPPLRRAKKGLAERFFRQYFHWMKSRDDKAVFILSGMRRSGNHALAHWLLGQWTGPLLWLNNLGPFQNPYENEITRGHLGGWGTPALLITYEDQPPEKTFKGEEPERFGASGPYRQMLLLRDPFNFAASRLTWPDAQGAMFRTDPIYRKDILSRWKAHAARYAEALTKPDDPLLPVSFNCWFAEEAYRRELSAKLSLTFSDRGKNKVSLQGSGSSFDGRRYHGKAQLAPVLQRFAQLRHDVVFQEICQDQELAHWARLLFNMRVPID